MPTGNESSEWIARARYLAKERGMTVPSSTREFGRMIDRAMRGEVSSSTATGPGRAMTNRPGRAKSATTSGATTRTRSPTRRRAVATAGK